MATLSQKIKQHHSAIAHAKSMVRAYQKEVREFSLKLIELEKKQKEEFKKNPPKPQSIGSKICEIISKELKLMRPLDSQDYYNDKRKGGAERRLKFSIETTPTQFKKIEKAILKFDKKMSIERESYITYYKTKRNRIIIRVPVTAK